MLFVVCGAIQRGHKIKLQANTCTEHDGAKKKKIICIKGVIRCKIYFNMVFKHKCVLAVFVHIHPIMIKIHPVFFLNPYK